MEKKNLNEVDVPKKDVLDSLIVPQPHDGNGVHRTYDVRFDKISPHKKLAQLRRQSTSPEFL